MASNSNVNENWQNAGRGDSSGHSRGIRTVKILLDRNQTNYSREMLLPQLSKMGVAEALEACVPTAAPYIWLLTFSTMEAENLFESQNIFECNNGTAKTYDPNHFMQPRLKKVYA